MNYLKRSKLTTNPAARVLFELIAKKQTNLCLAADLTDWHELLKLIKTMGSEICVLKTHIDIIENLPTNFADKLNELKNKFNFLIFEDRKFADIGNTVKMQYAQGIYKIADWADITNCHIVPGPGVIEGLREIGLPKGRGLLLLAEMSSQGNLATGDYTKVAVEWAKKYDDFVIGFIGMRKLIDDEKFITITPGVQLAKGKDNLGQQYNTPEKAIKNGSDIIIVGRGIYSTANPLAEAKKYREMAWQALQKR